MNLDIKVIRKKLVELRRSEEETNFEEISTLFDQLKVCEKVDIKTLYLLINLTVKDCDLTLKVFDFIQHKFPNQIGENAYTALISSKCMHKKFTEAFQVLLEMQNFRIKPHIRTFLPFFGKDHQITLEFFQNLIEIIKNPTNCGGALVPSQQLFSKMFDSFQISRDRNYGDVFIMLVEWIFTYYEELDEDLCKSITNCFVVKESCESLVVDSNCGNCGKRLDLFDITESERKAMLSILTKSFKNKSALSKFLERKSYDVVIDGANVAMYNASPFNWKKLEKVAEYFQRLNKRVLIILHIARKRKRKNDSSIEKFKNVDIFYSHKGQNDDLFWLYAALSQSAMVVTDDRMSDHLYQMFSKVGEHIFRKWIKANIIHFEFQQNVSAENWLKIDLPKDYSNRIQLDGNFLHIPKVGEQWMCCKIN